MRSVLLIAALVQLAWSNDALARPRCRRIPARAATTVQPPCLKAPATTETTPKPLERTAPVIEYDGPAERNGQRVALFRLTNPSDKVATYGGFDPKTPFLLFNDLDASTRRLINYRPVLCGNGLKLEHELLPRKELSFEVILPDAPTRFRIATEVFGEKNYSAEVEVK